MSASQPLEDPLAAAVARLGQGGLVAYPTETVWGLGADAGSPRAVRRLRDWKGRGADQPLALLVEDTTAFEELAVEADARARRMARVFWPGPLTLVLPCRRRFAPGIARRDGAIGLRCSPHPVAAALARRLRETGVGPVTATSLNRHGETPARTRLEAMQQCGAAADLAAPTLVATGGPDAGGGAPSSVVDLTGAEPLVLRYGALGPEVIDAWLAGGAAP